MSTKMVNKIFIDGEYFVKQVYQGFQNFYGGNEEKAFLITDIIHAAYNAVEKLMDNRFIIMEDGSVFDKEICGCWDRSLLNSSQMQHFYTKDIKNIPNGYGLPTQEEIGRLRGLNGSYPFPLYDGRPVAISYRAFIVKNDNSFAPIRLDSYFPQETDYGTVLALKRLHKKNSNITDKKKIFLLWLANKLIPKGVKNFEYLFLLKNINISLGDKFKPNVSTLIIQDWNISGAALISFMQNLLSKDKIRADIKEYDSRMLEDTELGCWELWSEGADTDGKIVIGLSESLVARDPKSSIKEGVVGIDFGTKSTVVVYQEETTKIHPMRVGIGDLSKSISKNHYENPTVVEFNNIVEFEAEYRKAVGRPDTRWSDITISHTAINSLLSSKSEDFNSYAGELKQWAGDKNRKLKIVDKEGYIIDLPAFVDLEEEFDPIEIYAYYLGLYINNQHNGIFLNYILSFPVTYELEIRDKIIQSFYKGIKKSLPSQLHTEELISRLKVQKGASEPAAYAVVALQEYGFNPSEGERVFYGIFDFGGGTTDFDFGIWRGALDAKEARYDYVIEHFGAGGDRYLGGENLLELLAFELFKENKEILLKNQIQFILPPECEKFLGSEVLLSRSQEAKMNTKTLMEKLRPLWEEQEEMAGEYDKGILGVNLTDVNGKNIANFELVFDKDKLLGILRARISKGVKNFFEALRLAFYDNKIDFSESKEINIFLAGNSSKSKIVTELFKEEIEKTENDIKAEFNVDGKKFFKIFEPLGANNEGIERPNGKTGVAFGLIETRKGGKILVKDHNVEEDIKFKYYLGVSKKKTFKTIINRDIKYNKWIPFIDAGVEDFELYYTALPMVTTNSVDIGDSGIKKKTLSLSAIDPDALVYIRVVDPTSFEYVVATENTISTENFLTNIKRVEL